MKNINYLIYLLLLVGCFKENKPKIDLSKNTTLICRPAELKKNDNSEAITIFAHGDTIWFPDRGYAKKEFFLKEGKLFYNYCLYEGDLKKDFCENPGFISFFNGYKLVMYAMEWNCEIP